jgi:hypothetical protein
VASACVVLALAWTATLTLYPWSDESVGDLGVRRAFATQFLDGQLPYRDVPFEYPPLAAPVIAAPGVAGTSADAYWAGFAVLTLVAAVLALVLAGRLAAITGGSPRRAMLAFALTPLALGAIVRTHFDLVPLALLLAALLAIASRRAALGFVLLGLGAMTKGFPLIAAPIALAWLLARREARAALVGAAALSATVAVCAIGAVALSPSGALEALSYHAERPIQVESAPASVLLVAEQLGREPPATVASHRSTGLAHPLDGPVEAGFAAALAAVLTVLVALAGRRRSALAGGAERTRAPEAGDREATSARALVLASLTAVAALAAFGKVLSPQFLIWVAPLAALACAWRMWALAGLAAAAGVLTLAEFPFRYIDLIAGDPSAVALTALRNAALIGSVALSLRALTRLPRRARAPARFAAPVHRPQPR